MRAALRAELRRCRRERVVRALLGRLGVGCLLVEHAQVLGDRDEVGACPSDEIR